MRRHLRAADTSIQHAPHHIVILSGAWTSRSEVSAESKDLYIFSARRVRLREAPRRNLPLRVMRQLFMVLPCIFPEPVGSCFIRRVSPGATASATSALTHTFLSTSCSLPDRNCGKFFP
jgi:hypothetical protein